MPCPPGRALGCLGETSRNRSGRGASASWPCTVRAPRFSRELPCSYAMEFRGWLGPGSPGSGCATRARDVGSGHGRLRLRLRQTTMISATPVSNEERSAKVKR
jgi:hypothetical protein